MINKRTTIQITDDIRKRIKEIASLQDTSYNETLDNIINMFYGLKFKNEREFSLWFEDNLDYFGFKLIVKKNNNIYPDYIIKTNKGKNVKVELEFFSKNFILHNHDPSKVDLIVSVYTNEEKIKGVPVLSLFNGYPYSNLNVYIDEKLIKRARIKSTLLNLDIKDYIARLLEINTQDIKLETNDI